MEPWRYQTVRDLDQNVIERLRNFPREPDILVYGLRHAAALVCRAWLHGYHRLEIIGGEHLPAEGSFVMVANHASHLDALCLLAALPMGRIHRSFPAAAKDYFFVNAPRVLLAAVVVNALPFDRRTSPRQSLTLCRQLLDKPGNALIIFPEGTRSLTGEPGEFKPGIGLLAAGTDYPVVPCYLERTHEAWPKGAWFPRPRKVRVRIGAPRTYSQLKCGKDSAIRIANELREAVLALAGCPADPAEHSLSKEVAS
jgi:1-acyl-sn-glycerol-3-phosphate acyltransferase